ncbi:MAG TPA: PEP-CTERM sorting domain-containing protein [Phycisphaerae bacterium]|nr:PEP-CTERM sorting domain-containing protein [Phycisphaerales bacterium]HNO77947.1 PEP-CTERM sorting domain-containing protein [Phycisphaerae bacterium]
MKLFSAKSSMVVGAFATAMLLTAQANATVTLGHVDDFQDGTTQSWAGGSGPTNIPTGGPAGAGDQYLQLSSTGTKPIGTKNENQWIGDLTGAGITSIEADVANFGATDLELRVLAIESGFASQYTSTSTIVVPAGGNWIHVVFDLTTPNMTLVGGVTPDVATALSSVQTLLIRHQPGAPQGVAGSPSVVGQLGIDNITATPEPATLGLLALGGIAALRRRSNR